jgi:hypothetical protein
MQLTVKQHFYVRCLMTAIGCTGASQAFPEGYLGLTPALSRTFCIFNLLLAEVVCFKFTTDWEAKARAVFACEGASEGQPLYVA